MKDIKKIRYTICVPHWKSKSYTLLIYTYYRKVYQMDNFGQRLRSLRQKSRMTQSSLAQRLSLTKSVISAYENNQRSPSYDVLIHMAKIFHVSTDYLLGVEQKGGLDISGLTSSQVSALRTIVNSMKG